MISERILRQAKLDRPLQIAQAISIGKSRKEVAAEYKISVRTVEAHLNKLKFICDAADMAHLIAILFREKLIQ